MSFGDLDIILCNRLSKLKDENKFAFLYKAFESIDSHLLVKMKIMDDGVNEMKSIIARYFVTCLTSPDTFDLHNDI